MFSNDEAKYLTFDAFIFLSEKYLTLNKIIPPPVEEKENNFLPGSLNQT